MTVGWNSSSVISVIIYISTLDKILEEYSISSHYRSNNTITNSSPSFLAPIHAQLSRGLVFDGEIVAWQGGAPSTHQARGSEEQVKGIRGDRDAKGVKKVQESRGAMDNNQDWSLILHLTFRTHTYTSIACILAAPTNLLPLTPTYAITLSH